MAVTVRRVGAEATETMLDVIRQAFGARPRLDPPAEADRETAASLRARLEAHGGLLAEVDGEPAGALVFDPEGRTLHLRRFGVVPAARGRGVAAALVAAAVDAAGEFETVTVLARRELPETIRFWERHGFREVRRSPPAVELSRPVRADDEADHAADDIADDVVGRPDAQVAAPVEVPDAQAMRRLGEALARHLRAGDLVVLTGELGAGKTTFAQGLGSGLGVRGPVTSPSFVIARVHPSEVGGPALVHVDAYRLGSVAELDDLDLDTSLDEAITVVEWGEGLAEGLAESRLEVRIERSDEPLPDLDPRRVTITGAGPRWAGVRLQELAQ